MTFLRQVMGVNTWVRVLLVFVFFWGILIFLFVSKLNTQNVVKTDDAVRRLNDAIANLDYTKKIYADLRSILDEYLR